MMGNVEVGVGLTLGLFACACSHPEVELVNLDNFETFKVISVKSGDYFTEDGEDLTVRAGKTYIAIVSPSFGEVSFSG